MPIRQVHSIMAALLSVGSTLYYICPDRSACMLTAVACISTAVRASTAVLAFQERNVRYTLPTLTDSIGPSFQPLSTI